MSNTERPASATTAGPRRIRAVAMTYLTRPLIWLGGLVYLVAVAGVAANLYDPRPPFERMEAAHGQPDAVQIAAQRSQWELARRRTVTPRWYQPQPSDVLGPEEMRPQSRSQQAPAPETIRSLDVWFGHAQARQLFDAGRYPKLDSLTLSNDAIADDQLREILRLHRPRALLLRRAEKLTVEGFRALAESASLEWLELWFAAPVARDEPLPWPPNLRSLTVFGFTEFPLQRYQEWGQLSHLRTLQLRMPRKGEFDRLAESVVAALEEFPTRPRLYLEDLSGGDGTWALAVQPQFSRIAVRPVMVPRVRMTVALYAFLLVLLPTALGAIQLSGQGVPPWSVLTPGYARPHQLAAGGIWLTGAAVSAVLMQYLGVSTLAAMAVGGSGMLFYAVWERLFRRDMLGKAGFANALLAVVPIGVLPVAIFLCAVALESAPTLAGHIDWFLAGQRPVLAVLWIVADLVAGVSLLQRLATIVLSAEAGGLSAVPLGSFDLAGWTRVVAPAQAQKLETMTRWNPIWIARERRLEILLDSGLATTRSQRIALWIAGLPMQPREMLGMGVIMAVVYGVFMSLFALFNENLDQGWSMLLPAWVQVGGMLLILPMFLLAQHRKHMEYELLLSVQRRDWMFDWFGVGLRLVTPAAAVLVLGVVVISWLAPFATPVPAAAILLLTLAASGVVWGLSLLLGTLSWWQAVGTLAGIFLVSISAIVASVFVFSSASAAAPLEKGLAPLLLNMSAVLALLAAALIAFAIRRWRIWEVGRE